jgi:hypothetical protein
MLTSIKSIFYDNIVGSTMIMSHDSWHGAYPPVQVLPPPILQ